MVNRVGDARSDGNQIINISQGLYDPLDGVGKQLALAYKSNIVNVVSAGNNGPSITYPAIYSSVIAVGSSTKDNTRSSFSNYGPQIEFLAPGGSDDNPTNEKNIYTTSSNGSYTYVDGTSFAAPLVSGAASLLLAYKPNLTNDDVKNILKYSCDKLEEMNGNDFTIYCGYGRINLKKAMQLLEPPYILDQLSASGGTDYSKGPAINMLIYGANGLADGRYIVYRHEVRKAVSFNYRTNPKVWGRGVSTVGWNADEPNFAMGFCDAVPGSVTNTSATLYTYVYEVYDVNNFIGWYPTMPANTVFAYSVLGTQVPLSVSISGPTTLTSGQNGTWNASASGGTPSYHYQWYNMFPSDNNLSARVIRPNLPTRDVWFAIGTDSPTLTTTFPVYSGILLKCVVTDAANNSITSNILTLNVGAAKIGAEPFTATGITLPQSFAVKQNYPNPFNPNTKITFALSSEADVNIKVYDMLGRKVKDLINEHKGAGYYTIDFNASNLSSGVYLYRITAKQGDAILFNESKQMILMK